MKFLRQILTSDSASEVYDLVRVVTALGAAVGIGLMVYTVVWRGQLFDFAQFGTGLGLLLAAGGGAMWARKDIEKD